MRPLIDGDVLRYEIGFAAETGWRAIVQQEDALPPFNYVRDLLEQRLEQICYAVNATEDPVLYITKGKTFRYDIAKTQPYKGTRVEKKPWHYDNITSHMIDVMGAQVVTHIEADDMLTIEHVNSPYDTVLVSRDKDLRQVPGWFYSWELGGQPAFGPAWITKHGHLYLTEKGKLHGTGLPFFYSQLLTGDRVDSIPGIPGLGPVKVAKWFEGCEEPGEYLDRVIDAYQEYCGHDYEEYLLEQGRLCWMTRHLTGDQEPVLWEIGMED